MSSELQKFIETSINKREKLLNAEVISFPSDTKTENQTKLDTHWKLYDKSNAQETGDQLKAVIGICFMFSVLLLLGLYSSLI